MAKLEVTLLEPRVIYEAPVGGRFGSWSPSLKFAKYGEGDANYSRCWVASFGAIF